MPIMVCNDENHILKLVLYYECFACRYYQHFKQHIFDDSTYYFVWESERWLFHKKINHNFVFEDFEGKIYNRVIIWETKIFWFYDTMKIGRSKYLQQIVLVHHFAVPFSPM